MRECCFHAAFGPLCPAVHGSGGANPIERVIEMGALLQNIKAPNDVKKIADAELPALCEELR